MTYFIAAETRDGWREETADNPSKALVIGIKLREMGAKEVLFRNENKKFSETELEELINSQIYRKKDL